MPDTGGPGAALMVLGMLSLAGGASALAWRRLRPGTQLAPS
ncbi:MAG: LPXTG cell wall anchor domain-containing protein [Pseudonocardiaceae bacterium]